ncbi:hypothetical protein AHA02nite_06500 [Alkalibacillus haloalkaliphilus]|uniref:Uncharacterized protein n=1 Tax=Alkalibacillus haloalkaliphilus TaxID=94136 RepID=A0A511W1F2_9BACI|nr:hypothetical protein AHA02nite_06500 [Alkalibacillus haloalkaliphilus]
MTGAPVIEREYYIVLQRIIWRHIIKMRWHRGFDVPALKAKALGAFCILNKGGLDYEEVGFLKVFYHVIVRNR